MGELGRAVNTWSGVERAEQLQTARSRATNAGRVVDVSKWPCAVWGANLWTLQRLRVHGQHADVRTVSSRRARELIGNLKRARWRRFYSQQALFLSADSCSFSLSFPSSSVFCLTSSSVLFQPVPISSLLLHLSLALPSSSSPFSSSSGAGYRGLKTKWSLLCWKSTAMEDSLFQARSRSE